MNRRSIHPPDHNAPSLPDLRPMLRFIADVVRAVECTGQRDRILAVAPSYWCRGLHCFQQGAPIDRMFGGILVLEAVSRTPNAFPIILDYLLAECDSTLVTAA